MTFDELKQEIFNLTNRPDLESETESAIKAATLKAHQSDYYSKDIYETVLTTEDTGYIHSIDYPSAIPNFRSLKYIRKPDEGYISIISPEEIFDVYGEQKADIAYIAGRAIELRSSTQINTLIIAAYVNPIVAKLYYSSWVAENYPYAIIFEAARVLFKTIGYDEQSRAYEALVFEQYAALRREALTDVGY